MGILKRMRLYPNLTRLLMPIAGVWLRYRARREPAWGFGLEERFGRAQPASDAPVWIHAASMGEVNSAVVLVQAIRQRWPQRALRLTAFTATGCARWNELVADLPGVTVAPLPLDHPAWVARALAAVSPSMLIIVETEIWPNFLHAAHQRHIPVVMVSARISERSVRGWERWLGRRTLELALAPIAHVGAQTAADEERFRRLGAIHTAVDGSLKWDAVPALPHAEKIRAIEAALQGRRCWLAASTHEGEEIVVLNAHRRLQRQFPGLCLLLAPRHPPRASAVSDLCLEQGFAVARRSREETLGPSDIWLIDTLGELTEFFSVAEAVFMGGSLVPVGGHNLLEPAASRTPILTGPHSENAAAVAEALEQAGGLIRVGDASEIIAQVQHLLDDPRAAADLTNRAAAVLEAGKGALPRALKAIAAQLADRGRP